MSAREKGMKYVSWVLVAGVLCDMLSLLWLVITFDEWQYDWLRFPEALPIALAAGLLVTLVGVAMLMSGNKAGGMVGCLGGIVFLPVGLIGMLGCLLSREKIIRSAFPAVSAASRETPFYSCEFVEERLLTWGLLAFAVFGIIAGLVRYAIPRTALVLLFVVLFRFMQSVRRGRQHAVALYGDRLECIVSVWSSEPVCIPYSRIRAAERRGSTMRLSLDATDGWPARASIPLLLVRSEQRDEARSALAAKMRELGVLREN